MTNRPAMFAQAARGPLMLIVVGIMFALEQAGVIAFSRSWPMLIIAIGLLKLIERMLLNREQVWAPNGPATPYAAQASSYPPPAAYPQTEQRSSQYSDFRTQPPSGEPRL